MACCGGNHQVEIEHHQHLNQNQNYNQNYRGHVSGAKSTKAKSISDSNSKSRNGHTRRKKVEPTPSSRSRKHRSSKNTKGNPKTKSKSDGKPGHREEEGLTTAELYRKITAAAAASAKKKGQTLSLQQASQGQSSGVKSRSHQGHQNGGGCGGCGKCDRCCIRGREGKQGDQGATGKPFLVQNTQSVDQIMTTTPTTISNSITPITLIDTLSNVVDTVQIGLSVQNTLDGNNGFQLSTNYIFLVDGVQFAQGNDSRFLQLNTVGQSGASVLLDVQLWAGVLGLSAGTHNFTVQASFQINTQPSDVTVRITSIKTNLAVSQ